MIDLLLLDLLQAWDELTQEQPVARVAPRPDLWTQPEHAAAHSKRRTRQRPEPWGLPIVSRPGLAR